MDWTSFFVLKIFPILVIIIGLMGNFFGVIILSKKSMSKLPIRSSYRFLFISDSIYISQAFINYLQYGFDIDLTISSSYFCKIFNYFNYSLSTMSPFLLVYISAERLITIKFPTKSLYYKTEKFQIVFLIAITIYNSIYYLCFPFYFDVLHKNGTNNSTILQCTFTDPIYLKFLNYLDLSNRAIIPASLMISISIALSYAIFQSRRRVARNQSILDSKNFKKDLKFTITSIFLNLVFILFNLPISISVAIPNYLTSLVYVFSYFLFYFSYGINFYIIIAFNSLFRNELLLLLRLKSAAYKSRIRRKPDTSKSTHSNHKTAI